MNAYQIDTIKPLTMIARAPIVNDIGVAVPMEVRTYGDGWVEIFIKGRLRYSGKMSNETISL